MSTEERLAWIDADSSGGNLRAHNFGVWAVHELKKARAALREIAKSPYSPTAADSNHAELWRCIDIAQEALRDG